MKHAITSSLVKFGGVVGCVAAVAFGGASQATTLIEQLGPIGGIGSAESFIGTIPYVKNELVKFEFTIDPGLSFTFSDSGILATLPWAITSTATGEMGEYTETFGAYPVSGSLGYDLSTSYVVNAAPEPMTWALLVLGVGGLGMAMRAQRKFAMSGSAVA